MEAFRLFDKDGDGKVTRAEIQDLIKSLGGDPACHHVQVSQGEKEKNNIKGEICIFKSRRPAIRKERKEKRIFFPFSLCRKC